MTRAPGPGAYGKGGPVDPLVLDWKWCRTNNLKTKEGEKGEKEREKREKKGENKKKEKKKKEARLFSVERR